MIKECPTFLILCAQFDCIDCIQKHIDTFKFTSMAKSMFNYYEITRYSEFTPEYLANILYPF